MTKEIIHFLEKNKNSTDLKHDNWVLNNKIMFPKWITEQLSKYNDIDRQNETTCNESKTKTDFELLPHQKLVSDYLQHDSPYRGLQLYHGLGVGKTCSSIAIAEMMYKMKKLIVVLPKSLEANYVKEVRKCGNSLYKDKQYWTFYELDTIKDVVNDIVEQIPNEIISKQKGVWIPCEKHTLLKNMQTIFKIDKYRRFVKKVLYVHKKCDFEDEIDTTYIIPCDALRSRTEQLINEKDKVIEIFKKLGIDKVSIDDAFWKECDKLISKLHTRIEKDRRTLDKQISATIDNNIQFVHYNGLNKKNIEKHTKKSQYDNKVIVIDEVHNFIVTVCNEMANDGGKKSTGITKKLYDVIYNSKNSKIVCLSGTPIINSPHELAYLTRLIRGKVPTYEMTFRNKIDKKNRDKLTKVFNNSKYVDSVNEFDTESGHRVQYQLVPERYKIKKKKLVLEGDKGETHVGMRNKLEAELNKVVALSSVSKKVKHFEILPLERNAFMKQFYDDASGKVINTGMFKRRVMGLISYFSMDESNQHLMPTKIDHENEKLLLEMSNVQMEHYGIQRSKEITYEKKHSDKQVYKIFSRLTCNFVFPDTITRPWTNVKNMYSHEYNQDEMLDIDTDVDTDTDVKGNKRYLQEIQKCLNKLRENKHYYLEKNKGLEKYSPKFNKLIQILEDKNEPKGNVLIYSEFRTVEGLEVLGITLDANNFSEVKIEKNDKNKYILSMNDDGKEKYIKYGGTDKEREIILMIYNNDLDSLPESIKEQLKEKQMYTKGNLRGEIIRVLMITKAGAEGLSLKHVRQVHLIEPYWNRVRTDQVIGRANRTCSHMSLNEDERNFRTYEYIMKFPSDKESQLRDLRDKDDNKTTDQLINTIAIRKHHVAENFLKMLREASIECSIFRDVKNNMECLSDNIPDTEYDELAYTYTYTNNEDVKMDKVVIKKIPVQKVTITKSDKKEEYIYVTTDSDNNGKLFDLKIFKRSKIRKLVGYLKKLPNGTYSQKMIIF